MINIAICEDEEFWMEELTTCIRSYQKDPMTLYLFYTGSVLYDSLRQQEYQMVFMDIKLKDMNGMDLADWVKAFYPSALIIYVSNYDDYYAELVHHEPFAFLRKPFCEDKVHSVLDNGIERIRNSIALYTFEFNGKVKMISLFDISYFYSDNRTCNIVMRDNAKHTFYKKLDEVCEDIKKHPYFIRISKGAVVNYREINWITPRELEMRNGQQFSISKDYRKDALDIYSLIAYNL